MKQKFKSNPRLLSLLLEFIDILATIGTFIFAVNLSSVWFKINNTLIISEFITSLCLIFILWIVLLKTTYLARIPRTSSIWMIFVGFVKLVFVGSTILSFMVLVLKLNSITLSAIILFSIINLFVLFGLRIITYKVFRLFRANGHNLRNIIIIGGEDSIAIINKFLNQKEWGYRVIAIISSSSKVFSTFHNKVRIYPDSINIKSIVKLDMIDEVFYCGGKLNSERLFGLIDCCKELGVIFRQEKYNTSIIHNRAKTVYLDNISFLTIDNSPHDKISHTLKTIAEISIAFMILLMLSPLLVLISFLIISTSKGPAIFKQQRVGLRGRKFYIYKFRTMVKNAEAIKNQLQAQNESDGPAFKMKKDPRITPIGRFLRKTSLDEIPQLVNVIKGEMSLIGPRPPLPNEVEQYQHWQLKRLSVKPGLTCTWQIVPNRNDIKFERWMKMDIQYIDNWSLKSDIELFFKTFKTIISAKGY